jgi:membrane protease YdiL (CAAX protease family)
LENKLRLDGTFEAPDKNPIVGSFFIIFICGGIYFLIPSLILNIYIIMDAVHNTRVTSYAGKDFFEIMKEYYNSIKIPVLVFTGAAQYSILFGLSYFLVKKWHTRQIKEYFYYTNFSLPGILVGITSAVIIIPVVDFISHWANWLFPVLEKIEKISSGLFQANNPAELILLLFIVGLTPALCEEFLFRGYFQRTLQRKLKTPWHFIISGSIFALFHFQLISLPALIVVGIFLGFLYFVFRSIYVTIAAHFFYNSVLILIYYLKPSENFFFTANGDFQMTVVGLSFILLASIITFCIFRLRKNTDLQKSG